MIVRPASKTGIEKIARVSFFFLFASLIMQSTSIHALLEEETNTIAVYERVMRSVVNITTAVCDPEFFFCPVPDSSGSGSGIILNEDGTIVTNYHVVANAGNIQVTLPDGRRLPAEVMASSPRDDLAILRIQVGDQPLSAITMGNSDVLKAGEKVLAIGNPFGLGQSLTVGTVSMVGRNIQSGNQILRNLIQTDASINPGNSGGALVNSEGELVGMNTIILSPTGGSIGIGFAIPVNRIKEAVPGMMSRWRVWIGWTLAVFILYWILRRIYGAGSDPMR